jgi:BirA family biotin operon repressor/biotin-[acetyl-CoA-carboxylase] ligase
VSRALQIEAIRPLLRAEVVGREIVCLEKTESTNDLAWKRALEGAPEGLAVLAEEQTRGRGRFGRPWFAPPGRCLLGSVLLRPRIRLEELNLVTAVGALSVVDALEETESLGATIRFPNDVLVRGRKISGALVEARLISSTPDFFVVGIGINANLDRDDFPPELRPDATSIRIETGRETELNRLAAALLSKLDAWAGELGVEAGRERIQRRWRERSAMIGRLIEAREGGRTLRGTVEDVDVFEGLLIRTESGHVRHARAEHVDLVRIVDGRGNA